MNISKIARKVFFLSIAVMFLLIGYGLNNAGVYAATGATANAPVDVIVPEKVVLEPEKSVQVGIENRGLWDIYIDKISFTTVNGWNKVSAITDFSKMTADQKKIAVSLNGVDMLNEFTEPKLHLTAGTSNHLSAYTRTSARKTAVVGQKVGDFVFTIKPTASRTLLNGPSFNALIRDLNSPTGNNLPFTKVIFTDEVAPRGATVYDFSKYKDRGVVGWYDSATSTLKISTQRAGTKIMADTDCSGMFEAMNSLKSIELNNLNTSNTQNMGYIFYGCKNLQSVNVEMLDTSKVTDMHMLFYDCFALNNIDVSKWDTSNVTNMYGMFDRCKALTSINVSNWNVSKVTNMAALFYECYALQNVDVSKWNTASATEMWGMFYCCEKLQSINVSNFNVSKVKNFERMFSCCYLVPKIDVSKWNVSNATSLRGMFYQCFKVQNLDLSNWRVSNVTDMRVMFNQCYELKSLNFRYFNTSKVTDMDFIFVDCRKLEELTLGTGFKWVGVDCYPPAPSNTYIPGANGKWYNSKDVGFTPAQIPSNVADTYSAKPPKTYTLIDGLTFNDMMLSCSMSNVVFTDKVAPAGAVLDYSFDKDGDKGIASWNDTNSSTLYISTQKAGKKVIATSCDNMFSYNTGFRNIDLSMLDTSNVTDMSYMFSGCTELTNINLTGVDSSKVRDFSDMFAECRKLVNLDVSKLEGGAADYMGNMFYGCESLKELDLTNLYYAPSRSRGIFYRCFRLEKVIMGPNSSWVNTMEDYLPTPDPQYISGADGKWYNSKGTGFAPSEIPDYTADTYYASKVLVPRSATLDTGANVNGLLRQMGQRAIQNYVFTDEVLPTKGILIDISAAKDNGVVAYVDTKTSTITFSSQRKGVKIIANADCSNMFKTLYTVKNINLANLDVSNTTNMSNMFADTTAEVITIPPDWNTSKVTNMYGMFGYNTYLTTLTGIENWDVSNVTNMGEMFCFCSALNSVNIDKWKISNTANTSMMFMDCPAGDKYPQYQ